jgi:hypothetical protein
VKIEETMRPIGWLAAALAGIALALAASAQPVYKSTMPDGRVLYGPEPAPGASKVDTITPPPARTGVDVLTPAEKAVSGQRSSDRARSQAQAESEIAAARGALKAAEAARDGGKEPLPGERIGTAGGASRLTDDYFARQKQLEDDVIKARRRLEEAQSKAR